MTTSGQTLFELNRDDIVTASLRKIGALAKGQVPDAEDLTNGTQALNALVAEFQTMGMPLWKRNEYTLTFSATNTYTIGVGQTTNTPYPVKIDSAILRRSGGSAQDMWQRSRDDFNLLNTSSTGTPVEFTYQPYINYGVLKVWPTPDATNIANSSMEITYRSPIEGFVSATDTPDLPKEWQNALIYGLADLLAPEFGVPIQDQAGFINRAKNHLDIATNWNFDGTSMYIQPRKM
jgi:hypothetical protein